jgi:phosphonate transport system substrate-binding protein
MKWLTLLLAVLLLGCQPQSDTAYQPRFDTHRETDKTEYIVGIHPLHNPQRLMERYGPILAHINRQMPGIQLKLEASRNYDEFDKKLYSGHFDFAMPNPYETVLSLKHGYRVFGKMADDTDFRGIILVRRDSGIYQVTDLKGKKVAYPAPTALAATMMPQFYFQTHGINVNRDLTNLYVGSQESSILNVLRGHVAAGATWPIPWAAFQLEHPEQASQLVVQWQTESLPNVAWVVRHDVPSDLVTQFSQALFSLQNNAVGQQMLAKLPISHFEPATDATYQTVRDYLAVFSKTVRVVEQ